MSWLRKAPLNRSPARRVLVHPVLALRLVEDVETRRALWDATGRMEVIRNGLPYLVRPAESLKRRGKGGDG